MSIAWRVPDQEELQVDKAFTKVGYATKMAGRQPACATSPQSLVAHKACPAPLSALLVPRMSIAGLGTIAVLPEVLCFFPSDEARILPRSLAQLVLHILRFIGGSQVLKAVARLSKVRFFLARSAANSSVD